MADMSQIQSSVDAACSRYREDKQRMQQAMDNMSMYQNQINLEERELSGVQSEIDANDSEISRLQYEIQNSSQEGGDGNLYMYQKLDLLHQKQEALNMKKVQVGASLAQSRQGYAQAQNIYTQSEADLSDVRDYLDSFRSQMIQAADEAQRKIDGFNQSIQILGGASGNIFSSAANSQLGSLQASRNQFQENLYFAQKIIDQISSTIDDQGSARVLTLNRTGRETVSYETRFEREMTTESNRIGELAPSSPSYNANEWEEIMRDPPPFAGEGRHL